MVLEAATLLSQCEPEATDAKYVVFRRLWVAHVD